MRHALAFVLLSLSAIPKPAEPVALLQGTDPAQFELVGLGPDSIAIVDGEVRLTGKPLGYFATRQGFQDYVLTFEYRYDRPEGLKPDADFRGNSGVLLHINGPAKVWPACVEVQLAQSDPGAIFAELDDDVRLRMLAMTSVWTGNAEESEALTGEADIVVAAGRAVEHLPPGAVAVVRDGPEGCAVHADGETTDLDGYPQTAVDTNGAGDTHTGVLVACRSSGTSWVEAARRANAGGAIKVTRRGPATAPTSDEIDAFLAVHA